MTCTPPPPGNPLPLKRISSLNSNYVCSNTLEFSIVILNKGHNLFSGKAQCGSNYILQIKKDWDFFLVQYIKSMFPIDSGK